MNDIGARRTASASKLHGEDPKLLAGARKMVCRQSSTPNATHRRFRKRSSPGSNRRATFRWITIPRWQRELWPKGVTLMSASVRNGLSATAAAFAAGFFLVGLLSPAQALDRNGTTVMTLRLPWPAPIGHRQPTAAQAPHGKLQSTWERQQQLLNVELDRKLVICRGC